MAARMKRRWQVPLLMTVFLLMMAVRALAYNAGTPVFQAAQSAGQGCTLVAVDGRYATDIQAAVARINEIRLEACNEGVRDPGDPSRNLTAADYVPIQWSSDLEYIARVRAAEASVLRAHTRPNGDSCFTTSSPSGISTYGEVLAWNGSSDLITGISQWYNEKTIWVNQTGGVTGHYTQMIDPDNRYVGLAGFLSETAGFYNTTAGEFLGGSGLNTSQMDGAGVDCRVVFEILSDSLSSGGEIIGERLTQKEADYLDRGDSMDLVLGMTATFGSASSQVLDAGNMRWTSSADAVASVNSYGQVTINSVGSVVITAYSDSGRSASLTLTPAHKVGNWTLEAKSARANDGRRIRRCSICGDVVEEVIIPRITTVTLSDTTFAYNGQAKTPGVIVQDSRGNALAASDYTVSYRDNVNVGTATLSLTFKGNYTGVEEHHFYIHPRKVTSPKARAGRRRMTVTWKKQTQQVNGYEIQYGLRKNFSGAKTIRVRGASKGSRIIKNLRAGRYYYVRVRAYKRVDDTFYRGAWSKTVKVKIR